VSQVFAYEKEMGILRQITAGAGASTNPSTNKNGTLIAFQSSADLLGDGHDTGVSQIFWSEYDRVAPLARWRLTAGDAPREPCPHRHRERRRF
jgi:hypothetical protein